MHLDGVILILERRICGQLGKGGLMFEAFVAPEAPSRRVVFWSFRVEALDCVSTADAKFFSLPQKS